MRIRLILLALLLGLPTAGPLAAAIRVLPDPPALKSFEFYDNGLYYWGHAVSGCGGEFGTEGTLGTVAVRGPRFKDPRFQLEGFRSPLHVLARACDLPKYGGVARDDAYVYYSERRGIYRLAAGASNGTSATLLGAFRNTDLPGALMIRNGRLYFASGEDSIVSGPGGENLGRFQIRYFQLPTTNFLDPDVLVAHGGSIPNEQPGRIKKMAVLTIQKTHPLTGGRFDAEVGLALGERGLLLRFDLDDGALFNSPDPLILARNVTDFAVRRDSFEEFGGPISPRPVTRDLIYAAVNADPIDPCSSGGAVVLIDPYDGAQSTFWSAPPGSRVTAFGLDNSYLFASTHQVTPDGGLGCIEGQPVIRSKRWLAYRLSPFASGIDPNWDAIELNGGSNLRSDNQWLYFVRSNTVWRITNASPPLRFDYAALGLEAVQVIQDLNNSIPLIEGKRTVVRAYAHVAANTLGPADWFPKGELRAFRNGTELPYSPLQPRQDGYITASSNWTTLRTNLARSFLFDLPDDWVRAGPLTLRFAVNPAQTEYESGADPLANNSAQATLAVAPVEPPCFVFASIHGSGPNYWPWENSSGFWSIINRAKSMLPVPDIKILFTTERVSDEHVCVGLCFALFPFACLVPCYDPFDLATNDGWDEALEELECYAGFTRRPAGCWGTHWVGCIHPSTPNLAWGGLARRPGRHFLVNMNAAGTESGWPAFNAPIGGRTMAHEYAHNLGRLHVNQTMSGLGCGGSTPAEPDPNYPFDPCTIGATNLNLPTTPFGFDTLSGTLILPRQAADLLSYASTRWPSPYTYTNLLNALSPSAGGFAPASAPAAPPSGPYFVVRGVLNLANHQVKLKAGYTLPGDLPDPTLVQESIAAAALPQNHPYVVRVLDAAGALLKTTPLLLRELEDADPQSSLFNQFITLPANAAAVQILRNGAALAEIRASLNVPTIAAVQVTADAANQTLTIAINDADADGDLLYHAIQFSHDNGTSWRPIKINTLQTLFTTDTHRLPGGAQCRIRIITTDGFHSAVATSAVFALPKHAPELFVSGVNEGERLPYGSAVTLNGHALDPEDENLPGSALAWNLAGPTPRAGAGSMLSLAGLSPGRYTATLSGADSDGNNAATSRTFEILPLVVADAAEPTVDGDIADAAYVDATTVNLPAGVTIRLLHAAGNLYVAFSGMPLSTGNLPGSVALRIETDGSGSSATQAGDVAFILSEDGSSFQHVGNGAGFVEASQPSLDFKTVISRGEGGWSAEWRIPESLLGGWNHAARIELVNTWSEFIPFGGGFTRYHANRWPANADDLMPSTWTPAWFGTPPTPSNRPPVAHTPNNILVSVPGQTTVFLNGADSFDPDGDALTFAWTQIAGPMVALNNAATATPSCSFNGGASASALRFRLVVSDGTASSAPADTTVAFVPAGAPDISGSGGAERETNGVITARLLWPGNPGDRVIIQASSDLVHWVNVETNSVGFLRLLLYRDLQARFYPHRFYRLASAPVAPGCASVSEGLVSGWRAEGDGSDSAGNNHGALQNGAAFGAGKVGPAFSFDGINDYVRIPHSASLNPTGAFSVDCWIKAHPQQLSGDRQFLIVDKSHGFTDGTGWALQGNPDGTVGFFFGNGGTGIPANFVGASTLTSVLDDQWHHLAGVFTGMRFEIYLDGVLRGTTAFSGLPANNTRDVSIGQSWGGGTATRHFRGLIDEVEFFNRALSSDEVAAIFLAGSEGKCELCTPPPAGLVHWWTGDSHSRDIFGTNHITLQNGAAFAAGKVGPGFSFDGVDDVARVADAPNLRFGSATPMTVGLWVLRTSSNHRQHFIGKRASCTGSSTEGTFQLYLNTDTAEGLGFANPGGACACSGQDLPLNTWTHLAGTFDGTTLRLFINGQLAATAAGSLGPSNTAPLLLGGSGECERFGGFMDEVEIFNRALAADEIQATYAAGSAGQCKPCLPPPGGLVSWWRAEGDAIDATGSNHGTLLNSLTFAPGRVGQALDFAGMNQSLLLPASPSLDVGAAPGMTIEGWINPADVASQHPIAEWNSSADWGAHFWFSVAFSGLGGPGCLYANLRDTALNSHFYFSPNGIVQTGVWQHVAMTYDKGSGLGRLFHNGSQVAATNLGSFTPLTSFDLHLGYRPTPGPVTYRGLMDDLALYNRALTSNEVRALFLAGTAGKCPPVCETPPAVLSQNFETGTSVNYTLSQHNTAPGPAVRAADAGSTGRFLRLINDGVNSQNNSIAFPQIAPGLFDGVRAEFDFRLSSPDAPADGFAFMLIPIATYGTSGPGFVAPIAFEEPNIPGVFAVGFDMHPRAEPRNDVSVHWNGTEYANVTMADANVNLTSGSFHRATVTLTHITGGALVTVSLVRDANGLPSPAFTPIRDVFVPGLNPFSSRVEFAGRSGALDTNVDLDNIRVQYLPPCATSP